MTLTKAIEILQNRLDSDPILYNQDTKHAMGLGIEALERHRKRAGCTLSNMMAPLPSETED